MRQCHVGSCNSVLGNETSVLNTVPGRNNETNVRTELTVQEGDAVLVLRYHGMLAILSEDSTKREIHWYHSQCLQAVFVVFG